MDIMPPRVALGLATAAVVLCAVVAPIQWAQGNTARAVVLGFFMVISLVSGVSVLRRQRGRTAVETSAEFKREAAAVSAPASAPASASPAEDPRWHAETLADYMPDPADRRRALRWLIVVGVLSLAGTVACFIGSGITGDRSFIAIAVPLIVLTLVIVYGTIRNRADL